MAAPIRDCYGNILKEGDQVLFKLSHASIVGPVIKVLDSGIIQNPDPKQPPIGSIVIAVQINVPLNGQPLPDVIVLRGPQLVPPVGGIQ